MENKKSILIADEDQKLIVKLKDILVSMGYDVSFAIDGAVALQKVLTTPPSLIIINLGLKIIGGGKIAQILRANPRTSSIPFFFLSVEPEKIDSFEPGKDTLFLKPFNYDELVVRVEEYFKSFETVSEVTDFTKEISGHLSQISLVDLLQVFNMNKKNGRLVIKYKDRDGEIFIKDGNVINARIDTIEGEKAFYRLMMLKEERFNFVPEDDKLDYIAKISKTTDNLLMEGLRQTDEWEKMKGNFPALNSTVKLKIDPKAFMNDSKPITREIYTLLEFYSKVADIVDNASFSDYEVLKTLFILLQKGIIEGSLAPVHDIDSTFMLTPEQLLKIRKRLLEAKGLMVNRKFAKVLIMGENFELLKKIIQMFSHLKEFSINKKELSAHPGVEFLGIIGTLKLTGGMNLMFYSVPMSNYYKPLWNAFAQDVIDVILLIPTEESTQMRSLKYAYNFFKDSLNKSVKPVLISDGYIGEGALAAYKEKYEMDEIFNYYDDLKEGAEDFFVDLLI